MNGARFLGRFARVRRLCAAPFCVLLTMLAIYALKGVFPFGDLSVAPTDGDLEQFYTAMYTQWVDILRGKQSYLFSWMNALGTGISTDTAVFSCLSPLNLLLPILGRDHLLAGMSYLVPIKLALAAFSMSWYVDKRFPRIPAAWVAFFGFAYGLSGHMLMQYHNVMWLEATALLPPLMYFMERMLRGGRVWPFALVLCALFTINFYPAAQCCVFAFLSGGAYILLLLPRAERGRAVLRTLIGALTGVGAAAWAWLPAALQMSGAARMTHTDGAVLRAFEGFSFKKGMALCGAAFALVLIPWLLVRLYRGGRRREAAFWLLAVALPALPLLFSGIDIIWHFGSNIAFPYRYGFVTVFVWLIASARAVDYAGERERRVYGRGGRMLLTAGAGAACLAAAALCLRYGAGIDTYLGWMNGRIALMTACLAAAYALSMLLPNVRVRRALCLSLLLLQTGTYGYSLIAPEGRTIMLSSASSRDAVALQAYIPTDDPLLRVKNEDASLTLNYAKYLGAPTISGFSSSTPQSLLDAMRALGYGVSTYSVQDQGGTLFTDALLRAGYTVTRSARYEHDAAYAFLGETHGYRVYRNEISLPFGLVGSDALAGITFAEYASCFDEQNAIFAALSGSGTPLFVAQSPETVPCDGGCTFTIRVEGEKRIYLAMRGTMETKPRFTAYREDGTEAFATVDHPQTYYDGAVDLGAYTDETLTIVFEGAAQDTAENVTVGQMNLAQLTGFAAARNDASSVSDVTAERRGVSVRVRAEKDGDMLLLPVRMQPGWRCTVDGTTAELGTVAGVLACVPLEAGEHTVTLRFTPPGWYAGLTLSALSFAALLALVAAERGGRRIFSAPARVLDDTARIVLTGLYGAALLGMYLIPILYALFAR